MKFTRTELYSIIDSINKILEDIDYKDKDLVGKVYHLGWLLYEDRFEYEKEEWIKFDPDDPNTIPPKNTVVLLTTQGLPLEDNIHTWRTYPQKRHNAQGLPGTFTHWRPLPKPPVETE